MLKKQLVKLIDLKSIITIIMVSALVIGFFKGMINSNELIPLVTMILTFYFTRQSKSKESEE